MKILKQCLGVDTSQKELVVGLGRMRKDLSTEIYSRRVFRNKETGFKALHKWLQKNIDPSVGCRIVMEATGVYHQKFAHFMLDEGYEISIVLPNKISNYMRTLNVKTITDKTCGDAIAQFGLERKLENWSKPDPTYNQLQQLTRERDQIVDERTTTKNRLHAEESEMFPNKGSVKRMKALIRFLDKQEKEIKTEISQHLRENKAIKEKVDQICTIPGVGVLTAVIILAETRGFELIRNKKQLTSYAGMDIIEKQSGTSIKGKAKLSKKGNRHIRKALYLPSLTAVQHNPIHKEVYIRLVQKHGIKKKGLVAIQRKMLELAYILFKNDMVYDKEYEKKKRAAQVANSLEASIKLP
jgi:transposase